MDHRMDQIRKLALKLQQHLQNLIGTHRQLLDCLRAEKQALISSEQKHIEESVSMKQSILYSIGQEENARNLVSKQIANLIQKNPQDLTLNKIIHEVQAFDLKLADQLRSSLTALVMLIQKAQEQNKANSYLIESALQHVHEMKSNMMGMTAPKTNTYSAGGKNQNTETGPRLLSKEV